MAYNTLPSSPGTADRDYSVRGYGLQETPQLPLVLRTGTTVREGISGHGDMTSQMEQGQAFFARMADYCTLEGDIDHDEASLDQCRSKLAYLTPSQFLLTFWSRSGQGQGLISEPCWPFDKFMRCLCL